ncbi:putative uncharacterized protein DDB_G0290521, partial [Eurytemora carolleeae]|uniref:putative uncharacterized protein DDB_G0290521 n=1 Tax=Eurytemora carolleeae TaxID=1294199 RepID=UPI000C774A90
MEEDILDSPTETKHMPPSPSQPILSPHSSTSQHVTPTHSQHVTTVPSQHVTPAHSQNVTPVPSQHVTPAHSQNVTPVPSRHVTPVQSPHAPPLPFQNMHPEDFMKPLEINEEESVLPTPRVRRLTRHHTLKYSGGALHDLNQSPSFDHTHNQSNQFNHSQNQSASSDRTKNQSASSDQPKNQSASSYRPKNQSASFDRTFDPPASKQRIFSPRQSSLQEQEFLEDRNERKLSREGRRQARHTSINDEDDLEDRVQSEGSMRYKLPPLVNVEDDRASLRGDQSDENRENSPSFKPSLLVVNPTVFKSASMSNMSSMSGISGDSTNSIPARNRIFVGTWNMNGQIPPRHLCEFLLPANLQYVPDVLVVGTQETFPEKTEWE